MGHYLTFQLLKTNPHLTGWGWFFPLTGALLLGKHGALKAKLGGAPIYGSLASKLTKGCHGRSGCPL